MTRDELVEQLLDILQPDIQEENVRKLWRALMEEQVRRVFGALSIAGYVVVPNTVLDHLYVDFPTDDQLYRHHAIVDCMDAIREGNVLKVEK